MEQTNEAVVQKNRGGKRVKQGGRTPLIILGTIVGAGTGLVCTLLGLAWSLIIISIAWLRFRPIVGGAMIGVAVLLIAALYFKGRAKKAAPAPAPQAPAE